MTRLAYLGPEGTFTHQAALTWVAAAGRPAAEPVAVPTVTDVYVGVAAGTYDLGIVAIENSVEGYVVPSLDAIVGGHDVVAIDETVLDITFDAFVRRDHEELLEVTAHPHGLAQCQDFVVRSGLLPVPSSSNAAACRDATVHQVAIGPPVCAELYGLDLHERAVEDFAGARTRFLTIASRDEARRLLGSARTTVGGEPTTAWRTMLAVTPTVTGPGVLARITRAFGASGVNLSSLITRPLKAQEGKYVFVLTIDAAPWESGARAVLAALLDAGDSLKTLGVFPARGELDEALDTDHVPTGSVGRASDASEQARGLLWD